MLNGHQPIVSKHKIGMPTPMSKGTIWPLLGRDLLRDGKTSRNLRKGWFEALISSHRPAGVRQLRYIGCPTCAK